MTSKKKNLSPPGTSGPPRRPLSAPTRPPHPRAPGAASPLASRAPSSDATYLDALGTKSANAYADVILKQIADAQAHGVIVELPLGSGELSTLLDNTVHGLTEQGKINWDMPIARQQVFIDAWFSAMQRKGIA